MPVQYYLPRNEADLVIWFINWAAKIQTYGTTVGLSAAEKAQASTDAAFVQTLINAVLAFKAFTSDVVAFKDIYLYSAIGTPAPGVPVAPAMFSVPLGAVDAIIKRTQQTNERIRNHPSYTVAIGQDLGIIGPEAPPQNEPTNVQATALPGSDVRITYNKGRAAGVVVYSKRGAELNFTLLSIDTNTPYVDTRDPLTVGQPETRTYRLQLYDGDNPVGDYSDEVSVVTLP